MNESVKEEEDDDGSEQSIAESSLLDNHTAPTEEGSWLLSWLPPWPSWGVGAPSQGHRDDDRRSRNVSQTLLMELIDQMTEKTEEEKELEKKEFIRQMRGVDYSWLISTPSPRPPLISEIQRLNLEVLFSRVLPDEFAQVIDSFRTILETRDPPSKDYPGILRAVVLQFLSRRSPEPKPSSGLVDWLQKSATGLTTFFYSPLNRTQITEINLSTLQNDDHDTAECPV